MSSCVHENFNEVEGQNAHGHDVHSVKEIQYDELLKTNSRFRGLHDKVMKINNQSKLMSRGSFENANGFTIVNTVAKIVETDSIISYTLLVEKDVTEIGSFDNLVIQTDKNGERPTAYLLTYKPTEILPSAHGSFRFKGKVLRKDLPLEALSYRDSATRCGESVTFTVCTESWSQPGTTGDEHLATPACRNSSFKITYRVQIICDNETGLGMGNGSTGNFSIGIPWDGVGGPGGTPSNNGVYTPPTEPDDIIANPVTSPVIPQIKPDPKDPCTQLKNVKTIPTFDSKMIALKNNISGTKEMGFIMRNTASNPISEVVEGDEDGNLKYPLFDQTTEELYKTYGTCHNHLENHPDHIGVFTPEDLGNLFGMGIIETQINNPHRSETPEKALIMVITNIGLFALKITDLSKLTAFCQDYKTWTKDETKDYMKQIFQNPNEYNIRPTSTHDEQVKGFLRFMQDKDLGIELFEGNKSDFGGWRKLTLQSNGGNNYSFTVTPCL